MKNNCVVISSLTEYIEAIKKNNLQDCFYRGENQKYDSITSSLIRDYKPTGDIHGLVDIYTNLLSTYFQEVGYELDSMQTENFLAFSQHHGLKTNLVDFTTAPLVALYFACDRKEYNVKSGYVYVLQKDSTVDASSFLCEYSINRTFCHNIFSRLAYKDEMVIRGFKTLIEQYAGLFSGKNPYDLVNDIIRVVRQNIFLHQCNAYINERINLLKSGYQVFEMQELILKYLPGFDVLGGTGAVEFIALFVMYLIDISSPVFETLPQNVPFPRIPYLIYKTPLKFDRIKNQSGLFLYQGFFDYQTDLDVIRGLAVQKIEPDYIIEVHNQSDVMGELDLVGINRRLLFGDFDNTAQYINSKLLRNQ